MQSEQVEIQEDESETVEHSGEELFADSFIVGLNDLTLEENVISIEMPKIAFKTVNGQSMTEKSPVLITLKDKFGICPKIYDIAFNGLKNFSIVIKDEDGGTQDLWTFESPSIKAINFGQIISSPQPEERVVQCEIEYVKFTIKTTKLG